MRYRDNSTRVQTVPRLYLKPKQCNEEPSFPKEKYVWKQEKMVSLSFRRDICLVHRMVYIQGSTYTPPATGFSDVPQSRCQKAHVHEPASVPTTPTTTSAVVVAYPSMAQCHIIRARHAVTHGHRPPLPSHGPTYAHARRSSTGC